MSNQTREERLPNDDGSTHVVTPGNRAPLASPAQALGELASVLYARLERDPQLLGALNAFARVLVSHDDAKQRQQPTFADDTDTQATTEQGADEIERHRSAVTLEQPVTAASAATDHGHGEDPSASSEVSGAGVFASEIDVNDLLARARRYVQPAAAWTPNRTPVDRDGAAGQLAKLEPGHGRDRLQRCYANLQCAIELIQRAKALQTEQSAIFARALQLAAHSQLMVREAARAEGFEDGGQRKARTAIVILARRHGHYVSHFLKQHDRADFANLNTLCAEVALLGSELSALEQATQQRAQARQQLRVHLGLLHDQRKLELRRSGIEAALECLLTTPCEPPEFQAIEPDLVQRLKTCRSKLEPLLPFTGRAIGLEPKTNSPVARAPVSLEPVSEPSALRHSPTLERARSLVGGSTLLMIGGEADPAAQARLERDLELREFRWRRSLVHQGSAPFETDIRAPDVAVVLLPIRWSGHNHVTQIKLMCERHGKPVVMLPSGYGSEQVAHRLLEQLTCTRMNPEPSDTTSLEPPSPRTPGRRLPSVLGPASAASRSA